MLAATFLFWVTLYIYVPTLPSYIKTKTELLSKVGFVLSMYGLWMAFARLPMGLLVDWIGWGKPLIILGLFFACFGAFIMGKGKTLTMLTVGRALTGVSAATWVPLIAVFSTFFSAEQAIMASSMLTFSASFGRMISTSITGFLTRMGGYSFPFFLATGTGILAVITIFFIKEEKRPPNRVSLTSLYKLMSRQDVLLPTMISIVLHYAEMSVTFGFLPILAHQMGASDIVKSVLIGLNIAAISAANLLNTFLLKRLNHLYLLLFGAFQYCVGILIIAYAPSISVLFVGTMNMGFAFGIVYPIVMGMSIENVDRSQRTSATGIHQSFYAVGMFTGPWLNGMIADRFGIQTMFLFTAGFYFLTVYFFIYLLARREVIDNK